MVVVVVVEVVEVVEVVVEFINLCFCVAIEAGYNIVTCDGCAMKGLLKGFLVNELSALLDNSRA